MLWSLQRRLNALLAVLLEIDELQKSINFEQLTSDHVPGNSLVGVEKPHDLGRLPDFLSAGTYCVSAIHPSSITLHIEFLNQTQVPARCPT